MSFATIKIHKTIFMVLASLLFSFNLGAWFAQTTVVMFRLVVIMLDAFVLISYARKPIRTLAPEIWIYGAIIVFVGFMNKSTNESFFSAIIYATMIVMSFLIFQCAQRICGEERVFNSLFAFLGLIMIVVDILIITTKGVGMRLDGRYDHFYYIGSKFVVSYFNMLLFALYLGKQKYKRSIQSIAFAAILIYICYLIDCMTGVTGLFTIIIIYFLQDKVVIWLKKPSVVICAIILSGAFALSVEAVTNIKSIQWLLVNVLNTDLDMTGRSGIFAILTKIFTAKPLFGYGYGNTAVRDLLGYGNPQNGFFDILISYGLVGIVSFINVVYSVFKSNVNIELSRQKTMMIAFIYAMILCGTVEINFSLILILALGLYKTSTY